MSRNDDFLREEPTAEIVDVPMVRLSREPTAPVYSRTRTIKSTLPLGSRGGQPNVFVRGFDGDERTIQLQDEEEHW